MRITIDQSETDEVSQPMKIRSNFHIHQSFVLYLGRFRHVEFSVHFIPRQPRALGNLEEGSTSNHTTNTYTSSLLRMTSLTRSVAVFAVGLFVCSLGLPSRADDEVELVREVLHKPDSCDRLSKKHDLLSMHYTGTLTTTGVKFDSSHDRNQPFEFQLGVGQVIQGWEQGLLDMCVGEKRKLVVPPHMAYGDQGAGQVIPPKASLTFEVELMDIKDGPPPPNVFKEIDANEDKLLSQDEVSSYLKNQQKRADPSTPPVSDEQHNTMLKQIFDHEDKDKDGFISHQEFSGPKHDEL